MAMSRKTYRIYVVRIFSSLFKYLLKIGKLPFLVRNFSADAEIILYYLSIGFDSDEEL